MPGFRSEHTKAISKSKSKSNMEGILGDHHRIFIQAFMWKKICSSEEVRSLHKKCHEKTSVPSTDLKPFVEKINSALSPMNMSIVKGIDETTEEQYYVLINTTDNAISRLSSEYKPNEIELFRKIINCIIVSNDGKATSTSILNFADDIRISKKEADEIITKFSQDGWLIENEGYISFSTRAIVELQHFFKEHFKGAVVLCNLCKNIVFQGDVCKSCDGKIHRHCKRSFFADVGKNYCPACRDVWH